MSTCFRISELRRESGMTQAQLAKTMALSTSTVGMWESGARKPPSSILPQLANVFGCAIDELYKHSATQAKATHEKAAPMVAKGGEPKMGADEKVKAFVARIMEECEQEGLTLAEVTAVAVLFDTTVSSRISDIKAETKFTFR